MRFNMFSSEYNLYILIRNKQIEIDRLTASLIYLVSPDDTPRVNQKDIDSDNHLKNSNTLEHVFYDVITRVINLKRRNIQLKTPVCMCIL